MKMLILNVIRLFILTLGATLVQASDVSDVAYCEAISNEISHMNKVTSTDGVANVAKLNELQQRYISLCSRVADARKLINVEQYVDCRTMKADAIYLDLDAEVAFKTCSDFKIQKCEKEMIVSENLAQAQAGPGQEAELTEILENIYFQNAHCKARVKQ